MPEVDKKDKAIADLTEALEACKIKMKEQDEKLKELSALPGILGQITAVLEDGSNRVVVNGNILADKPKHLKKLERGDWIHIAKNKDESFGMLDVIPMPLIPAVVMKIVEVLPDGRAFFDGGGGNLVPVRKCLVPVEEGDRVLMGGNGPMEAVVMENLGKGTKQFQFTDTVNVTWEDIGGQALAKAAMIEAIEFPVRYAALYKSMGKAPLKGVLLEGPPGCGKTMLAKAAANALRKLHGDKKSAESGYIYVKGPEVLSKWVGEAERVIRELFESAREHKRKHGYPAVIFLDECEAILSKRGSGVSSDMEKTIVPSFLAELDGLHDSGALVILATNRADRLDSAVVRDGRIDRTVRVTRPSKEDSADIFSIHLQRIPTCSKPDAARLSEHAVKQVFSHKYILSHVDIGRDEPIPFALGHCVSGAMIAGVVDKASSVVIKQAIAAGVTKASKIEESHIDEAVHQTFVEMVSKDHTDDIAMLAEAHGGKVRGHTRVTA